jgi:voltage-gated potassium channel
VGYRAIEGWPLFDALYMAVITLTTIGFGEIHPLTTAGRVFTMAFAVGGIFTFFFAASEMFRIVVGGELQLLLGVRRMEKKIASLKGHVVVCGYGRMGREICDEFTHAHQPYVIVDRNPERLRAFALAEGHPLVGDATDDEVLRHAGIERARAMVVVMPSDADNLFVTMSARLLNDKIAIVARADDDAAVPKLIRAGATRVVTPYALAGGRVAQAILRPAVLDFIEVATRSEHLDLQIEEVSVHPAAPLDGASLEDSGLRSEIGLIVVAVKSPGGHMVFNPGGEAMLRRHDTLIVLGRREQLDRAVALARGGLGRGTPIAL